MIIAEILAAKMYIASCDISDKKSKICPFVLLIPKP